MRTYHRMTQLRSSLGSSLAFAVGVLTFAPDARACHFFEDEGASRTTVCFTSIQAALATAVFAPVDVHYGLKRRWLPPKWAWTQLVLGGLVTMGGGFAGLGLAAADGDTQHRGEDIAWSLGLVAVGGIYGSAATMSLQSYHPNVEDAPAPPVSWTVAPGPGGAMVVGRF